MYPRKTFTAVIFTLLLSNLFFPAFEGWAFTGEMSGRGICCRAGGGMVFRILDDMAVIRMVQPRGEILLESRLGKSIVYKIKVKNINPASFQVNSGSKKTGVKILCFGENYAMLQVSLPAGGRVRFKVSHKLGEDGSFSFSLVGDPQGNMKTYKKLLNKIEKNGSLFAVILGDLVEQGTEKEYAAYKKTVANFPIPLYHIAGNHDVTRGGWRIFEQDISPMDYSFDMGRFHFIMLDSSRWKLLDYQWKWLEKELKGHKNCLVFMHVPPFSPDRRLNRYTMARNGQSKEFRALMSRYRVKAVFCGHIHGYQGAIKGGVPYYITGGGGAAPHLLPWEGGFHHYLMVNIKGDKLEVKMGK